MSCADHLDIKRLLAERKRLRTERDCLRVAREIYDFLDKHKETKKP